MGFGHTDSHGHGQGHAHAHTHGHLHEALQSQTETVRRVTWVGLVINLLLAVGKITAGTIGNSRAVVADGVHSVTDMVTDVMVLVGARLWSAPADEDHPYGHRRLETLITVGIGLFLAVAGFGIAWDAITAFTEGEVRAATGIALFAALASIAVKEILYHWTVRAARRVKSSALKANAWHHRSDALSSLPAAAAAGVSMFLPGWAFVDLIGAVVVAMFILHAAWSICRPALDTLMDRAAPQEVLDALRKLAFSIDGVEDVHNLRTRYHGSSLLVDMHVGVDRTLSVGAGHDIGEAVEDLLREKGPEIMEVLVHVDPWPPDWDDANPAHQHGIPGKTDPVKA